MHGQSSVSLTCRAGAAGVGGTGGRVVAGGTGGAGRGAGGARGTVLRHHTCRSQSARAEWNHLCSN